MKPEMVDACSQLVAGSLSGLYQGMVLAVLVGLGLRVLGRTNAATRHAVWFVTLLLVVCLIPTQCLRDCLVPAHRPPPDPSPGLRDLASAGAIRSRDEIRQIRTPARAEREQSWPAPLNGERTGFARGLSTQDPGPGAAAPTLQGSGRSEVATESAPELQPNPKRPRSSFARKLRWLSGAFLAPVSWNIPGSSFLRATSRVLLVLWLAVAGVRGILLARRLVELRSNKSDSIPADGELSALFRALCAELSVKRRVKLKISPSRRSPVLVGFVHPVVLLPTGVAQLGERAETEAILRHELAHVRRWDDWANLVQHIVQATFFFHPAVWWISRRLSLEREIACDDNVLQRGGQPRAYALLLTHLAGRMTARSHPLLAPGVTTKSHLQQRIDMILNTNRNTSPRLAKTRLGFTTAAATLLAALAIGFGPRLVLAQTSTPPASQNAPESLAPVAPAAMNPTTSESTPAPPEAPPARLPSQNAPLSHHADVLPSPPGASPAPPPDSSLEARLLRLEKLVQSLVDRPVAPHALGDTFGRNQPGPEGWPSLKEIDRLRSLADREATQAAEQARRSAKEADNARRLEQERRAQQGRLKDATAGKQLESLRKARESLERQMEKLNRQIEQLEKERQHIDQEQGLLKLQQQQIEEDQFRQQELLEEQAANEAALLQRATN